MRAVGAATPMTPRRRALLWCAGVAVCLALWPLWKSASSQAGTHLSQYLLRQAWEKSLNEGKSVRPWLGAHVSPVARIEVPRLGADLLVLTGGGEWETRLGAVLLPGAALPGGAGNSVVFGASEPQFRFLRQLRPGDELLVETRARALHRYRVLEAGHLAKSDRRLRASTGEARLTVAICSPVQPTRSGATSCYAVVAEREFAPPSKQRWPQMLAGQLSLYLSGLSAQSLVQKRALEVYPSISVEG